jgi:hypothetical protein
MLNVGVATAGQWQPAARWIAGTQKSRMRSWQPFINHVMHPLGWCIGPEMQIDNHSNRGATNGFQGGKGT